MEPMFRLDLIRAEFNSKTLLLLIPAMCDRHNRIFSDRIKK